MCVCVRVKNRVYIVDAVHAAECIMYKCVCVCELHPRRQRAEESTSTTTAAYQVLCTSHRTRSRVRDFFRVSHAARSGNQMLSIACMLVWIVHVYALLCDIAQKPPYDDHSNHRRRALARIKVIIIRHRMGVCLCVCVCSVIIICACLTLARICAPGFACAQSVGEIWQSLLKYSGYSYVHSACIYAWLHCTAADDKTLCASIRLNTSMKREKIWQTKNESRNVDKKRGRMEVKKITMKERLWW